jgi:hypothetical protein
MDMESPEFQRIAQGCLFFFALFLLEKGSKDTVKAVMTLLG